MSFFEKKKIKGRDFVAFRFGLVWLLVATMPNQAIVIDAGLMEKGFSLYMMACCRFEYALRNWARRADDVTLHAVEGFGHQRFDAVGIKSWDESWYAAWLAATEEIDRRAAARVAELKPRLA